MADINDYDQTEHDVFDVESALLDGLISGDDAEVLRRIYAGLTEESGEKLEDDYMPLSNFSFLNGTDPAEKLYSYGNLRKWNKISDRYYCGGDDYLFDGAVLDELRREGITHVLDCRGQSEIFSTGSARDYTSAHVFFDIEVNPTGDDGGLKGDHYFLAAIRWAREVFRTEPEAVIYVHCAMGINRGPSNLLAIVCALEGLTIKQGMEMVRKGRPGAAMAYWRDVQRTMNNLIHGKRAYPVIQTPHFRH